MYITSEMRCVACQFFVVCSFRIAVAALSRLLSRMSYSLNCRVNLKHTAVEQLICTGFHLLSTVFTVLAAALYACEMLHVCIRYLYDSSIVI